MSYEVGQKVAFLGDADLPDPADHPCKGGQCTGTVLEPSYGWGRLGTVVRVKWEVTCEHHKGNFLGILDNMEETLKTSHITAIVA